MDNLNSASAAPSKLTLLACQIAVPQTVSAQERDRHVARTASAVEEQLNHQPVDLVVLPELSSIEYSRNAFDNLADIAEDLDGSSFAIWSDVARRHNTTVVFGIARPTPSTYRISQLVVGSDGNLIGYYDKIHIAQYGASMEKEYFERADSLFVFDIKGIRIAPIICYDIRIPELTRTLCVRHGVELVLHCGAYSRDQTFYSWHHFVVARALENQSYVLSLNRAGDSFGSSVFCPPWVDAVEPEFHFGDTEEFRRFIIDTTRIAEARRHYPFLADRLVDYDGLPFDNAIAVR